MNSDSQRKMFRDMERLLQMKTGCCFAARFNRLDIRIEMNSYIDINVMQW